VIDWENRMWTPNNRPRYDRSQLRYESDLTHEEWGGIGPLIPSARRGGNKRKVNVREVVNGVMDVLATGCQWRVIPKDLPPEARSTAISNDGPTIRRWSGCTLRCM